MLGVIILSKRLLNNWNLEVLSVFGYVLYNSLAFNLYAMAASSLYLYVPS